MNWIGSEGFGSCGISD